MFLRAVLGLERRAPDLAPPALGEVAEILAEAVDQVGLGEQRIDREIDLQLLVQLQQPLADRVGVGGRARSASSCQQVLEADGQDDAVDRLLGAVRA